VKCFCNARNVIPYIQDIEIINAFCDGVSDIKTVEEIAMKKPKTVADLLVVAAYALRLPRPGLDFLSPVARGPQRRSRTIEKSTQLVGEIAKTADIMGISSSSPRITKKRDISVALTMQRSGVRSIVPLDMI
jgi:hypothetical protein